MTTHATEPGVSAFTVGSRVLTSRLIVGTGKYADFTTMREALDASGVLADDNEAGQALWGIAEMLLGRQS